MKAAALKNLFFVSLLFALILLSAKQALEPKPWFEAEPRGASVGELLGSDLLGDEL